MLTVCGFSSGVDPRRSRGDALGMRVHDRRFLIVAVAVLVVALVDLRLLGFGIPFPGHPSEGDSTVSSKDITVVRDHSTALGWRLEADEGFRVQEVEIVGYDSRTAIDWVRGTLGETFFEGRDRDDGHVRWILSEDVDFVRFAGGVVITSRPRRFDARLRGYGARDGRLLWETSTDDARLSLSGDPDGFLVELRQSYEKTLTVTVYDPHTGARLRTDTVDLGCRLDQPPATFHTTLTVLAACGDPNVPPSVPVHLDVEAFTLGASSGWITVSPIIWTSRAKMV
jgi:hypothetical protein